jgi:hypothetical protein
MKGCEESLHPLQGAVSLCKRSPGVRTKRAPLATLLPPFQGGTPPDVVGIRDAALRSGPFTVSCDESAVSPARSRTSLET